MSPHSADMETGAQRGELPPRGHTAPRWQNQAELTFTQGLSVANSALSAEKKLQEVLMGPGGQFRGGPCLILGSLILQKWGGDSPQDAEGAGLPPQPHSAARFPLEMQKAKPTHSWRFQFPGQVHCDIMRRKAQMRSDGTGCYHGAIQWGLRLSWSLSAGRCQRVSQKKKIL